ncbi:calcium-binding mitochondrial carrier protein SCaMC-1 [Clonorchis sinensis]|uniref:Calcium-binding mitochondrial carrier protein SCaMC-1 n=1 Tax=Clonorchis sinensis TaxID=79923 RepID=G7YJ45_CLOSI|nr:calcium-binding mitochondrial carrier protein SCaMC-1 [Clonorchis sinensis]
MVAGVDGYSTTFQDDNQLEALFKRLDVNKDGKISTSDIINVLEELHGKKSQEISSALAESFLRRCGVNSGELLDYKNFVDYVREHDKRLVIAFDQLDKNKSGRITVDDIRETFAQFDMPLTPEEAEQLLRHVDQAGNLNIEYGEWREFLLFHPAENLPNIFEFWRYIACIDVGSDVAVGIPEDFPTTEVLTPGKQLLQLTAGAIAGAVSRTCTAPIDRLKLMRQVYGYKHKGTGFVEAYRYMLREGGPLSLWRGNGINILKIAPETALKYGTYEHYKRLLTNADASCGWFTDLFDGRPPLAKFVAGSMAGLTAQTIIYPLEVLKTRMCLRKTGQFRSIWHCAHIIYTQYGAHAFYRGYLVNVIGIIPYAGIELALYERCKSAYIQRYMTSDDSSCSSAQNLHPPTYVVPIFAAVSSACAIVATYPASLVRAKLQATYWSYSTQQKITAINLIRTIWRDDGISGLYRGMLTNLTKVIPAVGISLATYEALRREFNLGPLGSG